MKTSRLYEQATVLELGARGRYGGRRFTLAGRTCLKSEGGGLWNEWTMRFDDGEARWLAEARGSFTVFVEAPIVPSWDALAVGEGLAPPWIVVERGTAERVLRAGETPDGPRRYRYADLSSREGARATIDYGSDPPASFVGRRVELGELGLTPRGEPPRLFPVPELSRPRGVDLWLSIGDVGRLDDGTFRVVGVLARSLREDGERYGWTEYLLSDPRAGYRWLVEADGHMSLVESVEPGLVRETDRGAVFGGETYRALSSGKARLDWASGELPWAAEIGATSSVRDYVRAPRLLSRESTADEVTWSLATYLPPGVVARAFRKRSLPRPVGRAPHQPRRSR